MSERHARSPLRVVVAVLTLLTGAAVARAQEPAPFDLDWKAPVGCPSADRLRAEITRLIGPNAHPPGVTHVTGEVSAQDNGSYSVKLELDQGGRSGERTLIGATCPEVSRAAALLIALAIEPDAREEPEPPPPPPPPPPKVVPPRPPPPPPPPPPAPALERHVVLAVGAAAEVGLLPTISEGGEVSLGAELGRASFEAYGVDYLDRSKAAETGTGGGRFSLRSFGLRGCAMLAPGDLSFAACGGASLHHLSAQGYGVSFPGSAVTNVGALSLAVRVELSFGAHASLRLDAGPSYMLGQAHFVLEDHVTVYRITSFDAGGSLKLAWRF